MKYLFAILLLVSCNPIKRVMDDPNKFEVVAREVVRRGYCTNDTVVVTKTKDSVVYKDSVVKELVNVPCKDFDTTIGRARIRVVSGTLYYKALDSIVYKTKVVTNTITDRKLENVLRSDVAVRDSLLASARISLREAKALAKELQVKVSTWKHRFWLLIALAVALSIGIRLFKTYLSRL